jgi:hypothetical protein
MSFTESMTYIYSYIAFAVVYLIGSVLDAASALRVSSGISRLARTDDGAPTSSTVLVDTIGHGRRLLDYTQVATLLPLVYIVGSMFLGSLITKDTGLARPLNIVWLVFTLACALTAIVLSVLALRESRFMTAQSHDMHTTQPQRTPETLQKLSLRLGVSATLLLLVAVFIMLNLWSVIGDIGSLSSADFLL